MKTLVTGTAGFIGYHLYARLAELGISNENITCSRNSHVKVNSQYLTQILLKEN